MGRLNRLQTILSTILSVKMVMAYPYVVVVCPECFGAWSANFFASTCFLAGRLVVFLTSLEPSARAVSAVITSKSAMGCRWSDGVRHTAGDKFENIIAGAFVLPYWVRVVRTWQC
jgi:hypothetical protein